MITLTNASIKFHTNDDDKDGDTHVTVEVRDFNQVVAARIDSDFGKFRDQTDNGPFQLSVKNASTKTDMQRGNVTIRINPNGNDTWRFNFYLDLLFSDGTRLQGSANDIELRNTASQSFGLEGILH